MKEILEVFKVLKIKKTNIIQKAQQIIALFKWFLTAQIPTGQNAENGETVALVVSVPQEHSNFLDEHFDLLKSVILKFFENKTSKTIQEVGKRIGESKTAQEFANLLIAYFSKIEEENKKAISHRAATLLLVKIAEKAKIPLVKESTASALIGIAFEFMKKR